ncbi:MAG: hypothetical protein K2Q22_16695, partial [Cytophagales bacterium]|nr:hypothetical protein [Cytophagales bacterium]
KMAAMLHLTQTNWAELLDSLRDILLQDESKLENNISFYKKLHENPNTDRQQLENLYQKITWEQNRLYHMAEIVNRLYKFDLTSIAEELQTAMQSETQKKNGKIENWSFTIVKEDNELRTYFHPLPNA